MTFFEVVGLQAIIIKEILRLPLLVVIFFLGYCNIFAAGLGNGGTSLAIFYYDMYTSATSVRQLLAEVLDLTGAVE